MKYMPNNSFFSQRFLRRKQGKKLILFVFLVGLYFFRSTCLKIIHWSFQIPYILTADEIGLSKCPACFGINSSLCRNILDGKITVKVNGFWTNEYIKNVMYGRWGDQDVVVKYLASNTEIIEFDRKICESSGMKSSCDLKKNAWKSFLNNESSTKKMLQNAMDCPSHRLVKKIIKAYAKNKVSLSVEESLYLSTGLHLNHEIILFKTFQKENGWPLPKYYGSCGRVIVVENGGMNLQSFQNRPWPVRARVALNLIKLAHKLASGMLDEWVFYLGDTSAENFGVNKRGDITLLDIEHTAVTDMGQMIKQMDEPSCKDYCSSNKPNCLQFSPSELCKGRCRDHNLYAICRGVLVDMKGHNGLLHSAPIGKFKIQLNKLLQDCVSGQNGRREDAILKVENLLENKLLQLHQEQI